MCFTAHPVAAALCVPGGAGAAAAAPQRAHRPGAERHRRAHNGTLCGAVQGANRLCFQHKVFSTLTTRSAEGQTRLCLCIFADVCMPITLD